VALHVLLVVIGPPAPGAEVTRVVRGECHAFAFEERALEVGRGAPALQRNGAPRVEHAPPGHVVVAGQEVERIAHRARRRGRSEFDRDLAIGDHAPAGHAPHECVDRFIEGDPEFVRCHVPRSIAPMDETLPEALSGIRVINAGQILAAPFCATLLAEFGAEVIKVEQPGTGESNRGSVSFAQDNRNAKAVTIDLHKPEGVALFRRLCDVSDVLIENFRPGTLERFGVGPDSLRETNPGLVAVRVSGYGQTGPYRDRAGFDRVGLGFGGMTYVTGYPDRPPVRPGYMVGDYGAGVFAAFGALTALQARERTGRGQDVDVALYEAVWRMSGAHVANYSLSGEQRERSANYFPGVVPAEQFETSDGHYVIINATTQRVFERLSEAMGQPDLPKDPRFTPRRTLMQNYAAVHEIIGEWVKTVTMDECQRICDEYGVPASKVFSTSDIVRDPHYAAREQVIPVGSHDHGEMLQPGIVPRLTGTPGRVKAIAPRLGEHNEEIFGGLLGCTTEELEALRSAGAI
jgi:crotonobetainyl-CoA:carnitine CoA-transferase CaiB-like acyl-CoA transferase